MTYRTTFASGRHLAAARTMAGLKQTELAQLAGLHVNSLKRLERMASISRHSKFSLERLADALAAKGIQAERLPFAQVRLVGHGAETADFVPGRDVPEGQLSHQYARAREGHSG